MPPRIVVVGSLMMDLVVRSPRMPAPGESLLAHGFETQPGGKGGNQAVAAARMGASTVIIGKVGSDRFGSILREKLEAAGVDTGGITVDPAVGTGVAVPVVLDGGQNAIFAVPQANLALRPVDVERCRGAIEAADMLLLQFEVGMEATLAAARLAHAVGVPVMLNPAPIAEHPPELVRLATVVVANEVEAAALAPGAAGDHAKEVETLRPAGGIAVVTLGADGAVFGDGQGVRTAAAFPVQAVDSVGAGDAFCGALAVALAEGLALEQAVRLASAAGALAVTRPGAQASLPARADVEALAHG